MKRNSIIYIIIFVFALSGFLSPALAHFPITDGNMTAILHVDPDDNPIPGQSATLYFLFNDITNQFSLQQCQCTVTIFEHAKNILQTKLVMGKHVGLYGQGIPMTFPARDIYSIMIQGVPIDGVSFQPFTITWNFRVEQYPLKSADTFSFSDVLLPVGLAIGGSFLLFAIIFIGVGVSNRVGKK